MVRILIVDDHEVVRRGIRNYIERHAGWTVCGEAADGRTAFALARELSPDIAVVDITLPAMNGLALTRRLRQSCPNLKTLLFSMLDDDETVASALAVGARGFVLKSEDGEHLGAAITALAGDRSYFSPPVQAKAAAALQARAPNWFKVFTVRELEVAQLVAEGNSNKVIAYMLGISPKTVEIHRAAAMRKADVHSASEMVRFAIRHRLIDA